MVFYCLHLDSDQTNKTQKMLIIDVKVTHKSAKCNSPFIMENNIDQYDYESCTIYCFAQGANTNI